MLFIEQMPQNNCLICSFLDDNSFILAISFEFKNNEKLCYLINYFESANLSSESKFYKIKRSQRFLEIRKYRKYPLGSIERQIFDDFLED